MGPVSAEMNIRVAAIAAVRARGEGQWIEGKRGFTAILVGVGRNSTGIASGSNSRNAVQNSCHQMRSMTFDPVA
jgi:hypothetical protein